MTIEVKSFLEEGSEKGKWNACVKIDHQTFTLRHNCLDEAAAWFHCTSLENALKKIQKADNVEYR